MQTKIKAMLKSAAWVALLLLAAVAIIGWSAAGNLLHPNRKPIQDYQQEWIRHPSSHGVTLHAAQCVHGKVPCLFISPDSQSGPGKRGAVLRKQLASRAPGLRPYGETQGILLLLHGRNGRKEDLLSVAERFAAAGFNCVIPDLPAHGDSPINSAHFATSPFERDLADNVLADARKHFGDPASPAGIWGMSMGGTFAIMAVSQSPAVWKAVVIVSSFDSLEGLVEDKLSPLPGPLSGMLGHSLDFMADYRGGLVLADVRPDRWATNITTPVFIAHGDHDSLISLQRGQHLFNAFRSPDKSWTTVPGANHSNILVTGMPLFEKMSEWFIAHVR